jgi:hypothetical protein
LRDPTPGETVFFVCSSADFDRERLGYVEAFRRRGVSVLCLDDAPGADRDLGAIAAAGLTPRLIVHPDSFQVAMPAGLETSTVPTACFHIDSFVAWQRRARWAQLFDHVFVFHAADIDRYRAAGNPDVIPLFHAARLENQHDPEATRDIDVAIVGRTGRLYQRRRRCLQALTDGVRTNEWWRDHRPEEAAALYARAKIVLNVGRDDFPVDVGVRFGEAMIAGALFATILPTELSALGFVEGRDFVGFHGEQDVLAVCRRYASDQEARVRIARAGQQRVLADHTYDRRVETMLDGPRDAKAPARDWSPARCALLRLDYFAAKGRLAQAAAEWPAIGLRHGTTSTRALALLGRAAGRRVLTRARSLVDIDRGP